MVPPPSLPHWRVRLLRLLLLFVLPSSASFGWGWFPKKKKNTDPKGAGEESTTTRRRRRKAAPPNRGAKHDDPKEEEAKKHHRKGEGKNNTTLSWQWCLPPSSLRVELLSSASFGWGGHTRQRKRMHQAHSHVLGFTPQTTRRSPRTTKHQLTRRKRTCGTRNIGGGGCGSSSSCSSSGTRRRRHRCRSRRHCAAPAPFV